MSQDPTLSDASELEPVAADPAAAAPLVPAHPSGDVAEVSAQPGFRLFRSLLALGIFVLLSGGIWVITKHMAMGGMDHGGMEGMNHGSMAEMVHGSMSGMVSMSLSAAILLLELILTKRQEGIPREVAIAQAGPVRLKAIVMTTFTTLIVVVRLAFFPEIGSHAYSSIATVILGGLVISTVLTLIVVPIVYTFVDDAIVFIQRLLRRKERPAVSSLPPGI